MALIKQVLSWFKLFSTDSRKGAKKEIFVQVSSRDGEPIEVKLRKFGRNAWGVPLVYLEGENLPYVLKKRDEDAFVRGSIVEGEVRLPGPERKFRTVQLRALRRSHPLYSRTLEACRA